MYYMYHIVNSNNILFKKDSAKVRIGTIEDGRWGWKYPEWGWIEGTCGFRVGIATALKKAKVLASVHQQIEKFKQKYIHFDIH